MFELIIIPVIVVVATQSIKLMTDGIPANFNFRHLINDYGGMPSSHTAFVTSLATVVGIREGMDSAAFAISFVLLSVVVRDAMGFRREIGFNAELTNSIAKQTIKDYKPLNEVIGHKPLEVFVGMVTGIVLASLLYWGFGFIK